MSTTRIALALAAGLVAATAVHAGDEKPHVRRVIVHNAGGEAVLPEKIPGDHLRIEDLATLQQGETRSYSTESGREVTVTARENGRYTLSVGGHSIEIGDDPEAALLPGEGEQRVIVRKHHGAGEEATETVEKDVLRELPAELAVDAGGEPPVVIEIVDRQDGKEERRVVVLRVGEEKKEQR
jgi:hypothetical protein